jgi:Fe-S oxidoreductase
VIGTACPFCMIMLDDAEKAKGAEGLPKILDLAQLVAASLAD